MRDGEGVEAVWDRHVSDLCRFCPKILENNLLVPVEVNLL